MIKYLLKILLLCVVIFNTNTAQSQPKIKIINPNIDFGVVSYARKSTSTKINIMNEGTDTLVMTNVKSECGCLVAEITNNKVAPGETTHLVATLNLTNLSGKVTKTITVTSNDTTTGRLIVTLNATIDRPFEHTPKYITFDKVIVGEPITTTITLKNISDNDAIIKNVSFTRDGFFCDLKENDVLKKKESIEINVTATANQKGSIRAELLIELFHPVEKSITLLIYGNAIEPGK